VKADARLRAIRFAPAWPVFSSGLGHPSPPTAAKNEDRMIPMIVTQRYVGEEGHCRPGARITARSETRARTLIEMGLARLDRPAGPAQNKALTPSENKPAQHEEKKSAPLVLSAGETGPSTASPTPALFGLETPAPSSPAAPASPKRRRARSAKRANEASASAP